jgi:glycosyltransferase involved in cell wall biosynthesis
MRVSVVVPCYNERATIRALITAVRASPAAVDEIIAVDDASTDGTDAELQSLSNEIGTALKIVRHEKNRGKGAALRTGFGVASGDVVIIQDADLEYDPADYPKLLQPILTGKADVVYGSRFLGGASHRGLYVWHSLGNRFLTFCSNLCTNLSLTDMETCYKVFRRDVLMRIKLEETRFGFEPEITAKIAKLGVPIREVGISYRGRTFAEGKKIRFRDGLRALYAILRYNLFG